MKQEFLPSRMFYSFRAACTKDHEMRMKCYGDLGVREDPMCPVYASSCMNQSVCIVWCAEMLEGIFGIYIQIEKFFQDRNLLLWHFHSTAPRKCILWVPAHSTDYTSTSPLSPEAKIGVFYQISGKQKKTTTYFSDFNIHCLI